MLTITIPETAGDAYELIRAHFSAPGAQLARRDGACRYRVNDAGCDGTSPVGAKCAVGCLVPDALYDKPIDHQDGDTVGGAMEYKSVGSLGGIDPVLDSIVNGDSDEGRKKTEFLRIAQRLHDSEAKDATDFVRLLDGAAVAVGIR